MDPELIIDDTGFNEGPVFCDDGTLVVSSVDRGMLYRIWPDSRRKEMLADTCGGPLGIARTIDGGLLVCQTGGVDLGALAPGRNDRRPDLPEHYETPTYPRFVSPSLQLVSSDGTVTSIGVGTLLAPNDLVATHDGMVFVTDPPALASQKDELCGRVLLVESTGCVRVVADGFWYCNGIAIDSADQLLVAERSGIMYLGRDGSRDWILDEVGTAGVDGFCLDVDDRIYAATKGDHAIAVIEDGALVEFLHVPGHGYLTNCCFGGDDFRTLYATDASNGTVVAWDCMPHAGQRLPDVRITAAIRVR